MPTSGCISPYVATHPPPPQTHKPNWIKFIDFSIFFMQKKHTMLQSNFSLSLYHLLFAGRRKKFGGGSFSKFGKYGKFGKIGSKKKKYKWLYPILIGLVITKMIMFPLFVKVVTILSSSAFVFSKMSLLASLILGLKFFLSNNAQNNDSKVEIVHVPLKKYGGDWDRETSESKFRNVIADNIYEHELRPTRIVIWFARVGFCGEYFSTTPQNKKEEREKTLANACHFNFL